jgi:carboxymethylenebutenolidase
VPEITFPTRVEVGGYLAVPEGDGPWPGVVVLPEAFGLNDDIRAQADHLARAGYLAVAPAIYSMRCIRQAFRDLHAHSGTTFAAIDYVRTWLAARDDCTGRVGVIGFCLGGGFALLSAPRGFDAASVNYGEVPADPAKLLAGACPIVASYGARDPMARADPKAPERLAGALTDLGVANDVETYPAPAGHSFLNEAVPAPLGPIAKVLGFGFDPAAASDAWARILAFYADHLRAPA